MQSHIKYLIGSIRSTYYLGPKLRPYGTHPIWFESFLKVKNISNNHIIILLSTKILAAIDESESAKKTFEESIYLAQKCNSKLDVAHVV